MKSILGIMVCVVGLSFCNLTKKPGDSNSNANVNSAANNATPVVSQAEALRQILAVEDQWKEAKRTGDTAVLGRVFADEFSNTDENGKTYTKAQWIAVLAPGDPTLITFKIEDAQIVSYGSNTATLTFTYTGTHKRGRTKRSRDTDTWVNRGGRWQVLASQSTPLR